MAAAFQRACADGLFAWMRPTLAPAFLRRQSLAERRRASVKRLFWTAEALFVPQPVSVPRLRRDSFRGKENWVHRAANAAAKEEEEAM